MSLKALYQNAEVRASLTAAGMNPERGFRFARPLPPFSGKENIHISKAVINQSSIALEDLKKGVALSIIVSSSKNKNGELSWTAAAINKLHIANMFSHIGVIDSGGVQYLRNYRKAWFLEDVYPPLTLATTKCIVFEKTLSKKGKLYQDSMNPGTLMMFQLERDRVIQAEKFSPEFIGTDFSKRLLTEYKQLKKSTRIEIVADLCERNLSLEETLDVFSNHVDIWCCSETAYLICNKMIKMGIGLEEVVRHTKEQETPSEVWSLIGENHQSWILENISDTEDFQNITAQLDEVCLKMLLANIKVEDILSVKHLLPWLSGSEVSSGLNKLFDDYFEPDDALTTIISKRLINSPHNLSNTALLWFPELWPSSNLRTMIGIIEQQKLKLIQNPKNERMFGLIVQAVGSLVLHNSEIFNDADHWLSNPSPEVSFILDLVTEFPNIEEELEVMSGFNMWDKTVKFEGPSRIWLNKDSLGKAWSYFSTNEKLLALHYLLANNVPIPQEIEKTNEEHHIVKAYLKLIHGFLNNDMEKASLDAHNHIIEGVLKKVPASGAKVAISQTELIIDFERALPRCKIPESSGVRFCEGNHRTKPSYFEYLNKIPAKNITPDMRSEYECHCPRLENKKGGYRDSGCQVEIGDGHGIARLFESRQLPWAQWTILEVLAVLGYPPNLISYFKAQGYKPRIQDATINHNEYVNKVAAVVNRIDDLRDRLRCGWRNGHIDPKKGCGKPLKPDFSYRVFPAAYGITVTGGCQEHTSRAHDKSTYFNHCKRCVGIIDSRESPIKDDSYINTYVCSACGGWGKEGEGEFKKCGKCGSYDCYKHERNKSMGCNSCHHTWNPPNKCWAKI